VKISTATFLASAPDLASCPASPLPEFALIGRSNVGKSSLINMLTGRDGLAKVSGTPGKTRLINFFTINGEWTLVDLPGYGYAKASRGERGDFGASVDGYLRGRANLRGTFILIDSRLTPQKADLGFVGRMVACGIPFMLAFTKADKVSAAAAQKNIAAFAECMRGISGDAPEVLLTSSKLGLGRREILAVIAASLADGGDR
jgi:GTP-binding protein